MQRLLVATPATFHFSLDSRALQSLDTHAKKDVPEIALAKLSKQNNSLNHKGHEGTQR
jgi:hypothetical protein